MSSCSVRPRRSGIVEVLRIAVFLALVAVPCSGSAQTADPSLWSTNGIVRAITQGPGKVYVGGQFDLVGPSTGSGVPLDLSVSALPPGFPRVNGKVYAVIADGAGGWYIGGEFNRVGSSSRVAAARINSNLTVSAWNPFSTFSGTPPVIYALARDASSVYLGGAFSALQSVSSPNLVKVNTTTGAVRPWSGAANAPVRALAADLLNGFLYAGGSFSVIAGLPASNLAMLDLSLNGAIANDLPLPNAQVNALVYAGGMLIVGGEFSLIGGVGRGRCAAIDPFTGTVLNWRADVAGGNGSGLGNVTALASNDTTIFIGGSFDDMFPGGAHPQNLAAVNVDGSVRWYGDADGGVDALTVSGPNLIVGGKFRTISLRQLGAVREPRNFIASLNTSTGVPNAWNPSAGSRVLALAPSGSRVFAGGEFSLMNAITRYGIAEFDSATGQSTGWSSGGGSPGSDVWALARRDSVLYVGGVFTGMGNVPRQNLAGLNTRTGAATALNVAVNSTVTSLAISGGRLFAAGAFTVVGGKSRNRLAGIDLAPGLPDPVLSWNPLVSPAGVNVVQVQSGVLYCGGTFTSVDGTPRSRLASFNAATGALTGWNPTADATVSSILPQGESVYVGGDFTQVNGVLRPGLARVGASDGALDTWTPPLASGSHVSSIAASGAIFVAGALPSSAVRAIHPVTGAELGWAPYSLADQGTWTASDVLGPLEPAQGGLLIGGKFRAMAGTPLGDLARVTTPVVLGVEQGGNLAKLRSVWPMPFRDRVQIELDLPRGTTLQMSAFDIAGRQVWRSKPRFYAPGRQRLEWSAADEGTPLQDGVYFLRVRGDGVEVAVRAPRLR